jgi:histidinol-phosphate aminotransferase
MSVSSFVRAGVSQVPLYDPEADRCAIDVSDNTNLWGAPPRAVEAIRQFAPAVARYPSAYSSHLKSAILSYVGLDDAAGISLVMGCGSDEVLDCTMRAFGSMGDRVSYCAPTFSMIPVFARLNGLDADPIPFSGNWDIDPERLVERRAKITYLCTPNNPTGTGASRAAIEYVVANAAGVVLLDSAYLEFASEGFDALVRDNDRLIVTHTFSKAFGLAGLRCGYGVGDATLLDFVARARGPYKVSTLAECAVAAALQDVAWVEEHVGLAKLNALQFSTALCDMGFAPLPTEANFVLVPTPDGERLFNALRARGVLVRLMKGLPTDHPDLAASGGVELRMGIGPWEMMEPLLAAIRGVR